MTDETKTETIGAGPMWPASLSDAAPEPEQPEATAGPSADSIAHAIVLLNDAKERLAANSLSDVGYFIGRAIQLLEG